MYFPYVVSRCGNILSAEDKETCPYIEGSDKDLSGGYHQEKHYDYINENLHHYLLHAAFTVGSVLFIFSGFLNNKAGGASGIGPWVFQLSTFLFILLGQCTCLGLMDCSLPRKSLLHYIGFSALSIVQTIALCISWYVYEVNPVKNEQWYIDIP